MPHRLSTALPALLQVFLLLLVQVSNVTPFNAIAPLVWLASRLRLVGPRLQRAMKEGDPLLLDLPWWVLLGPLGPPWCMRRPYAHPLRFQLSAV